MNTSPFLRSTIFVFLLTGVALAQDASRTAIGGDLAVIEPWARATPDGARVGAGYLTVENRGGAPDRLTGGSLERAGRVELHTMSIVEGVMRMRPLKQGFVIPPGGRVELKPGGQHIMFVDLTEPLREGELVKGTLTFERAGTIPVEYAVSGIAAPGPATSHSHR